MRSLKNSDTLPSNNERIKKLASKINTSVSSEEALNIVQSSLPQKKRNITFNSPTSLIKLMAKK